MLVGLFATASGKFLQTFFEKSHHISFNDQVLCDIHMTLSWICFCCVVQCDPWPNCIAIPQWFYWLIGYYSFCLITISYRTLLGNNTKNMLHTPAQRMFNEDLWLVAKNHWWHQHRQQSSSQLAPALMFKLLIREGILAIQQVNICLILFIMINLSHREMWQQMIFVLFVITNVIKKSVTPHHH